MTDTLSEFWHWFIVIATALSILGCVWLVWANSRRPKDGKIETVGHVWDGDLQEYNNPLPRWWLNMFYITLIFSVVYLVLYPGLGNFKGLLGWSQIGSYEEELAEAQANYAPLFKRFAGTNLAALAEDPVAMKSAGRLFSTYCSTCHGSDARGAPGFPNLRDGDWLYGDTPEIIKLSILNGRSGVMPAWGAALGEVGVNETVEYILQLSKQEHDAELAGKGEPRYKQFCIACHGANGLGNQAMGAANLTDDIWLYGGDRRTLVATISDGRQGKMPAHKDFLGENKVHLLAAYILNISKAESNEKKSPD